MVIISTSAVLVSIQAVSPVSIFGGRRGRGAAQRRRAGAPARGHAASEQQQAGAASSGASGSSMSLHRR